ncbi:MAG: hypothetical protein M1828_007639 [Chrysothrix sp. TS-e1954]|nr:MAG: hypothetical protein M1828_007639 [Chrysothrix sp. TS-e1954]
MAVETITVVAVTLSVLGSALIVACVFLIYKWRQTKQLSRRLAAADEDDNIPLQKTKKLVIHHGKVIPARQSWTPSFRSGWTSMRRRSWVLAATHAMPSISSWNRVFGRAVNETKSDTESVTSEIGVTRTVVTSEAKTNDTSLTDVRKAKKGSVTTTTAIISPRLSTPPNLSFLPPQPLTPAKTRRSIPKSQRRSRYLISSSTRTSHQPTITEHHSEPPPSFPRPPYLSPLESRYWARPQTSEGIFIEYTASPPTASIFHAPLLNPGKPPLKSRNDICSMEVSSSLSAAHDLYSIAASRKAELYV